MKNVEDEVNIPNESSDSYRGSEKKETLKNGPENEDKEESTKVKLLRGARFEKVRTELIDGGNCASEKIVLQKKILVKR